MNEEEIVDKCLNELLRPRQEFFRLSFLKLLTQISMIEQKKKLSLAFYGYYCLVHLQNNKQCLQNIQKSSTILHMDIISQSMILILKGAVMTYIQKHKEALECLKESIALLRQKGKANIHWRQIFIKYASKVLSLYQTVRGKRQFLGLFEDIHFQIQKKSEFVNLDSAIIDKIHEIRQNIGCHGKYANNQNKLTNSTRLLKQNSTNFDQQSKTTIYINRLYEQRRNNLSKRQKSNSNSKKNNLINPYQLKIENTFKNDCYLM